MLAQIRLPALQVVFYQEAWKEPSLWHITEGTSFSLHPSVEETLAFLAMAVAQGQKAELPGSACALRKDHKPWGLVAIGLRVTPNEAVSNCSPIYLMQK